MAAILNFSKTFKKSPAYLHSVGNVIVSFLEFLSTQNFLELPSGGHFEFW